MAAAKRLRRMHARVELRAQAAGPVLRRGNCRISLASRRLQCPIGTCSVHRRRKMVREQFECGIDRDAEMLGQLLHLLIAENSPNLLRADLHIGAVSKPGLNLGAKAALLQLCDQTLHIAEICLRQAARNHVGYIGGPGVAKNTLQRASQIVEESHVILLFVQDVTSRDAYEVNQQRRIMSTNA